MDLARHPLLHLEERLVGVAFDHDFALTHVVKYQCELQHPCGVAVYLDRQRTPLNVIAVMVHPQTDLAPLLAVPGLLVSSGIRHGSNMRRFPKRSHTGAKPITYGYSVECADLGAFGRLLDRLVRIGAPGR
ncbi:hypothetical protein [Nonomuraea dietziae]|uniref:Uncharacterized protein n=1 Tax=Nonomuraea dietziae TaxID=65515 RepID=A0A7W5V5I3_9ACTN|nr:hypothetical protein [Nonomuraea dietziae]MBB3725929.1 hypothetical protein [Nonomuraea dietziae]